MYIHQKLQTDQNALVLTIQRDTNLYGIDTNKLPLFNSGAFKLVANRVSNDWLLLVQGSPNVTETVDQILYLQAMPQPYFRKLISMSKLLYMVDSTVAKAGSYSLAFAMSSLDIDPSQTDPHMQLTFNGKTLPELFNSHHYRDFGIVLNMADGYSLWVHIDGDHFHWTKYFKDGELINSK
jgi:hypothetical protein